MGMDKLGRKSNAEKRKNQIIWALYDCLSEKGHETITIKKIAERAHLPHGVIHYYFQGKEEILTSLISSLREVYLQLWNDTLEICSEEMLIDTGITFLAEKMVLDSKINRVLYNLVQMGFEKTKVRKALRQIYQIYREQLADLFFASLPPDVQNQKSVVLLAIVEGLALQWMIDPGFMKKNQIKKILYTALEV